jgi:itaconyl-CoA hydratase
MVAIMKNVGGRRLRESYGRYYEDFEIGDIYEHRPGRTISEVTLSIVCGMSVSDVSQKAIGNLGWTDIKLTAPVFVGDTLYAESEVLAKRESAKRPTQGIVTVRTLGKKADGTQFMSFDRNILIPKRGHGVDDKADY